MKEKIILSCFALFWVFGKLLAQNPAQTLDSKIEKVTVFVSSAQITRTAKGFINQGKTEIAFKGISPLVDKASIQIKTHEKITVVSVLHQIDNLKAQENRKEVDMLMVQKKALEEQFGFENSMLQVYVQEEQTLNKNQEVGGSQNGLKATDLKEVLDFQRNRTIELKMKQIEISKKLISLQTELNKINAQLRVVNAKEFTNTSEILVTLESPEALASDFTLVYVVSQAGWFPNYDLKVESITKPILLSYKANVTQSTGEDWNNVKLTLATGNPKKSGQKPELEKWELGFGYKQRNVQQYDPYQEVENSYEDGRISGVVTDENGEPIPGVTINVEGRSTGTATDVNGRYSIAVNPNDNIVFAGVGLATQVIGVNGQSAIDLQMPTSTTELSEVIVTNGMKGRVAGIQVERNKADYKKKVKEEEKQIIPITETQNLLNISFVIDKPYTVPNDGKTYSVEIKEETLEATYQYYAAPKLDENAFLTAQIADWESYNLLNGDINLFFENTYLGKSKLDVQNVEDTLEISLGRDESVVISREKMKDFSKNQSLGGSKTDTRGWQISIKNKKAAAIDLIIEDQYPISVLEAIEVKLIEAPEAEVNRETGILRWKMNLAPSGSKNLSFKYSVKYPKGQVVVLE